MDNDAGYDEDDYYGIEDEYDRSAVCSNVLCAYQWTIHGGNCVD